MIEDFRRIDKEIINRVSKRTNVVKRDIGTNDIRYYIKDEEIIILRYGETSRGWYIRLNDLINDEDYSFASYERFFTEENFIISAYNSIMSGVKQYENKMKEQIKESKEEIKELINLFSKLPYDESSYTQILRNYLFAEFEKEEEKIEKLENERI